MEKNDILAIFTLYFSVVLLKFLVAPLIVYPTILFDEIIYLQMAQDNLLSEQPSHYPPLYPFLISLIPSDSIQTSYIIARNLNIFLSSLIIFPVFFLSRLFLNRQTSLIIGFFSLLIPIGFTYSFLIMSENLFYPLFLTSVYLIFKAEKEDKKWLSAISGIVMGLTVLTRIIGFVLIVAFVLYLFYKYILHRKYNIKQLYTLIVFLVVVLPWYLLKGVLYELSEQGTLGFITIPFEYMKYNILDTLLVINSHFIYLILGEGVILGLLSLIELYSVLKNREKTLFEDFVIFSWLCAFCTVIVCGVFLSGAYVTSSRYVAFLIPLFFIVGFKSLEKWDNTKRKIFMVVVSLVFFLSVFFISVQDGEKEILKCYSSAYTLTFENILLFEFQIVFVFILVLFLLRINIKKRRDIAKYVLITFICSLLVLGVINDFSARSLNTQKSFDNEVIGKYLANHTGHVVYDEDTYKDFRTYLWALMFWCDKDVCIGNTSSSTKFFVSSRNLSYLVISQQELYYSNGTVLYLYEIGEKE